MTTLLFGVLITASSAQPYLIRGLNVVAPPAPYSKDPMSAVKDLGANWIAVVPYAFTRPGGDQVHYDLASGQWWGERPVGVRRTVELAKKAGLSVLLKPQVYVPGGWSGDIAFSDEASRRRWQAEYRSYLFAMVDIAVDLGVEAICIGTELDHHAEHYPSYWQQLIADVRHRYDGFLTYAANWDRYDRIRFWRSLDAIGIDAYFPYLEQHDPSLDALIKHWETVFAGLDTFAAGYAMPYVFTEYGWLSVEGGVGAHWELEPVVRDLSVDEDLQARAYVALWQAGRRADRWVGGFLWKWFPNGAGHEGYLERDYTPQGKRAEDILQGIFHEIDKRD